MTGVSSSGIVRIAAGCFVLSRGSAVCSARMPIDGAHQPSAGNAAQQRIPRVAITPEAAALRAPVCQRLSVLLTIGPDL
jgi:hypothetical protein